MEYTVIIIDELDNDMVYKYGPLVENHEIFINRTNVQFVKPIDKNNIAIKIWERGAGYTLASGSSSCAAAYTSYILKLTENVINVQCDGGNILIEIDDNDTIFMTGEVYQVYEGILKLNLGTI